MNPIISPKLNDCAECGGNLKTVKKQFDFKIDSIPFRTKQKYERQQCIKCNEEYIAADVVSLMDKEFATARAFIAEQDRMYQYTGDASLKCVVFMDTPSHTEIVPVPAKQWHEGVINYLRQVVTGDKVSIIPAYKQYTIYCTEEEKLSIAAKQFLKPDDYFKLTSIV